MDLARLHPDDRIGLGGADQTRSVLVNGQANPIVRMQPGEIQRWRLVGATMQASAALRIGFPSIEGQESPEVRQIAMDGVQFSPDNYACQPFLKNPDCSEPADDSSFDELTSFKLDPGNRIDLLVKAPQEAGTHCLVLDVTTVLSERASAVFRATLAERAAASAGTCGISGKPALGPLFTLIVEGEKKQMKYPEKSEFPSMASYLADIPEVTAPALKKDIYYQMVGQTKHNGTQFWISQVKYDASCANETLVLDRPEEWTLWNNSGRIAHPFHIHQNPFQLISESGDAGGTYAYPVWRDTLAIPTATTKPLSLALPPNSDPDPANGRNPWGQAKIRYEAKEFTGLFVNHCHILGHEDRGMMHNTQASCADGRWAATSPVAPGAPCDAEGFCPSDCDTGERLPATPACPDPPDQGSDWPKLYGVE